MVNYIAPRNEAKGLRMVPLQLGTRMIATWRFARHETRPVLIHQSQVKGMRDNRPDRWINPWALREAFWQVKGEVEMLRFLNRTSIRWGNQDDFFLADVFKFQQFTKQAVVEPFKKWQRIPGGSYLFADATDSLKGILCQPSNKGLRFQAHYSDFKQAVLAAVVIDELQRNRYRVCAKRGCGKLFKIDSRGEKRHCTEAHRQAEAMRRVRLRKSRTGKGHKPI